MSAASAANAAKSRTDRLFSEAGQVEEDFVFNERVAEVFDDMIERSVPFYTQVIDAAGQLLENYLDKGDTVYDLGCSTGSTLLALAAALPEKELHYIGIDNSPPMIAKAREKATALGSNISFECGDITDFSGEEAGAVLLNYTLQFIRPMRRQAFVQKLYDSLRPGGVLILSEKTILDEQRLNRSFIRLYHQFKKKRGYSELEIARKREALENVLIPFSIEENKEMLRGCGFSVAAPFFQWFNFVSFIAVKD